MFVLSLDHFSNIVIAVCGFELVCIRVEKRGQIIVVVNTLENILKRRFYPVSSGFIRIYICLKVPTGLQMSKTYLDSLTYKTGTNFSRLVRKTAVF